MTVMSTSTRELSIGNIVTRSFQLAGVLGDMQLPSATDGAMGRDFLEIIIDGLATEGMLTRQIRFTDLALVVGQSAYSLSESTLDVVGDGKYIAATQPTPPNAESLVRLVRREEWNLLSSRSTSAPPTLMYAYRAANVIELRLWPTPNELGTIRLQEQRLLADNTDANATPDLQRYWAQFLLYRLASMVARAKSLPTDTVAYLASEAAGFLVKCKGKAVQRGSVQAFVDHRVSRRRF